MRRPLIVAAWLTLASAFASLLLVGFWLFWPYRIIEFYDSAYPVLTPSVTAGGNVEFTSDNCKYLDLPCTVSRTFVGDRLYPLPDSTTNIRVGCGKVTVAFPVPRTLPTGIYTLRMVYTYKVNPIRTITFTKDTEPFTVTNPLRLDGEV